MRAEKKLTAINTADRSPNKQVKRLPERIETKLSHSLTGDANFFSVGSSV